MFSLQLTPPVESIPVEQTRPFAPFAPFAPVALPLKVASLKVASEAPLVPFKPTSKAPLVPCLQWRPVCLIHLNFSELQAFTLVRHQYQQWGIELEDAIALQPSNPAFADPTQPLGLMPTCDRTPLTIRFHQPRQVVSARLTGSQPLTIRAFDAANRLIAEDCIGQFCYLQGSSLRAPTHREFQLQAAQIARIEIASEAPFLLRDLICG